MTGSEIRQPGALEVGVQCKKASEARSRGYRPGGRIRAARLCSTIRGFGLSVTGPSQNRGRRLRDLREMIGSSAGAVVSGPFPRASGFRTFCRAMFLALLRTVDMVVASEASRARDRCPYTRHRRSEGIE